MTKRTDRLNSEYRQEISALIAGPLKNREPELKGIVSVTEADVAPDLKTAKIYVSVYGKDKEEEARTLKILCDSAPFLRRELARVMRQRTVPALTVLPDRSMEYGAHMDELLASLNKDR